MRIGKKEQKGCDRKQEPATRKKRESREFLFFSKRFYFESLCVEKRAENQRDRSGWRGYEVR